MHRLLVGSLWGVWAMTIAMTTVARGESFDPEPFRAAIRRQLAEEQLPSVTVAVAREGKILWEEGFGWADRENRVAANEHTPYSMASITKPITGTALMVLAERGLIDLDAPAQRYLDVPLLARLGNADEATVRRLANHTSGLPLHYQFFYADEQAILPPRAESIRRYGQLLWPPGERYQYANFGYGILDHVIERVSHRSYAEFLRQEVFLPLGMTRSSIDVPQALRSQAAVRYGDDQLPLPHYDFDHPGASAAYASAHDLVHFGMFHLHTPTAEQRAILRPESIDAMQQATADTGDGRGYGVGWGITPDLFGLRIVAHSGGMGGVRTKLTLVPELKLAIVVLCNRSTEYPERLTLDLLGALAPGFNDRRAQAAPTTAVSGAASQPPTFVEEVSNQGLAGRWTGVLSTWKGDRAITLTIQPDGDVHVQLAGQLVTLLNEPRFAGGQLRGVFQSDLDLPDANRRPYHLHLTATLRKADDAPARLNGVVSAISLPGPRLGNALSYWIDVQQMPAKE